MRLLIVFMLLLPTIASANFPIEYYQSGNYLTDSRGGAMFIHQEAVIDNEGFEFKHKESTIDVEYIKEFMTD